MLSRGRCLYRMKPCALLLLTLWPSLELLWLQRPAFPSFPFSAPRSALQYSR